MLRLRCPPSALLMFLILPALISLPAGAATITVENLNDSGPGSLRQAVLDANAAAGADTIVFLTGLNGTLRLLSGGITITDSLTISGPGAGILAISGNNALQIFYINGSGKTFIIDGLTLKEGGEYELWRRDSVVLRYVNPQQQHSIQKLG